MHWPQYTILALWILLLGFNIARDGQEKTEWYETHYNCLLVFARFLLYAIILYCGGFWTQP